MKALFAALLLLITCQSALAEVYKWKDAHGVVHYTDQPPAATEKVQPASVETVELEKIQIQTDGSLSKPAGEQASTLDEWLGQLQDWQAAAMKKIDEWRGESPVVSNKTPMIDLYTTSWCAACKKAKRWLNQNNIRYTEYDVEKDRQAALRMRDLGGGDTVPFAIINGRPLKGFSPASYQAAMQ